MHAENTRHFGVMKIPHRKDGFEDNTKFGRVLEVKVWRISSLRRNGYRCGKTRCDKAEGTIESTVTFILKDVCADRSTEVERHSGRRRWRWGILVIQSLEDNDPNTTTSTFSSRRRWSNGLGYTLTYVLSRLRERPETDELWVVTSSAERQRQEKISVLLNSDGHTHYMRAIQSHSGETKVDPLFLDIVKIPYMWSEYINHVGSSLCMHSIIHSGLIAGRKDTKKEDKQYSPQPWVYERQAEEYQDVRYSTRPSGKFSRMQKIGTFWERLKIKDEISGKHDPVPLSFMTLCQPTLLKKSGKEEN